MDPRRRIQLSVDTGDYLIVEHVLVEADKDGVSQDQIEAVMAVGVVRRRELKKPVGCGMCWPARTSALSSKWMESRSY